MWFELLKLAFFIATPFFMWEVSIPLSCVSIGLAIAQIEKLVTAARCARQIMNRVREAKELRIRKDASEEEIDKELEEFFKSLSSEIKEEVEKNKNE